MKAFFARAAFSVVALLGVALPLGSFLRSSSPPPVDLPENLPLREVPGVTPWALSKKDESYRIAEPVTYYRKQGLALFDVEVLVPGFSQPNFAFTGDGERFNGFAAETEFVKGTRDASK